MICESGRVVSIENDWVWVETFQTTACQSCSAKAGCGQSVLNSVFSGKRHYVRVAADPARGVVQLHDTVEIAIPEHAMLRGSFWLYILPLLFLLGGGIVGNHLAGGQGDLYPILGAVAGFGLAALLVRVHSYLHRADPSYQPVLQRIVRPSADAVQPVLFQHF